MLNSYLLIADHDHPLSNCAENLPLFRAHLVAAAILNNSVSLSDAQILNSLNFRRLIQSDPVVRDLVKAGVFRFKIRKNNVIDIGETESPLHAVQAVFRVRTSENRMVHIPDEIFDRKDDLTYLVNEGSLEYWDVWEARSRFTQGVSSHFATQQTQAVLGAEIQHAILDEIAAENRKDNGLGRAYLQHRLASDLDAAGVHLSADHRAYIKDSVTGLFLSNLADLMQLSPYYSTEQKIIFDTVRQRKAAAFEHYETTSFRAYFSKDVYVHCLNQLSLEQILRLRNVAAGFQRVCKLIAEERCAFSDLRNEAAVLSEHIDDCFMTLFPEIRAAAQRDSSGSVRSRSAVLEWGIVGAVDLLSSMGNISVLGLGVGTSLLVNIIRKRFKVPDEASAMQARAAAQVRKTELADHLKTIGKAETIRLEENITDRAPHRFESIITEPTPREQK